MPAKIQYVTEHKHTVETNRKITYAFNAYIGRYGT
jgi:hypothetical protein